MILQNIFFGQNCNVKGEKTLSLRRNIYLIIPGVYALYKIQAVKRKTLQMTSVNINDCLTYLSKNPQILSKFKFFNMITNILFVTQLSHISLGYRFWLHDCDF